jgi:hypothetical protein
MRRLFACCLLLTLPLGAGCDSEDGDDLGDDDAIESGAGDEDSAEEATTGDDSGDGDGDGDESGSSGDAPAPSVEPCEEYSAAQACATGGTRYCDYFEGALGWGACVSRGECQLGESRDCGLDTGISIGCGLEAGVPAWDELACSSSSDAGGAP